MMIEDEELRNLYKTSSEAHLQKLEAGLLYLEKHPDNQTTLEELRRDVHSIKGDSRSLGLENVETIAQQVEEILLGIKRQQTVFTPQVSTCLSQGLAAIGLLVQEAVTGQSSGVDITEILNQLMGAVLDSTQLQPEANPETGNHSQLAPTFIEDEELRNLYKTSNEERLPKLKAGLLYLEKHPDNETTLEELRRDVHSIKGDSRSLGLENVEAIAQQVEEVLLSLKRQQTVFTPQVSACLSQGLDMISLLVQEAVTGQSSGVDITEILNQLMGAVLDSTQLQPEAIPENGNPSQLALTFIEDEELRDIYKSSNEERLQKLKAGLLNLENHPNNEITLEELQRDVHSIKGDSRSLGLEIVETIAQQVEEIFLSLKRQQTVFTPQVSACLYQGLDAIDLLVQEAVTGQPSGVELTDILNRLMKAVLDSTQLQPEANPENGNPSQLVPTFIEDEELRDIYKTSSEAHLQKIKAGLLYLEKHPNHETTLEELLRDIHSIKGDSRSLGIEIIETIAHQIEKIFLSLKRQQTVFSTQMSACLYQGLDAIDLLVQETVTGQPSGVAPTEMLSQLMKAVLESTPPPPETATENSNSLQLAPTFIEDEELRDIYKTSSEERLQKLEASLLHLEKYPDNETTLEELLREVHSFKGDSRSVGLENVEALTHQVEEILLSIKRQQTVFTPQVSAWLYQGLDAIDLLVQEAVTGKSTGIDTVQILNDLMETVSFPTIQESLPVSPEIPTLPDKISTKAATQDLLSPLLGVGEPHRSDTIRVQTRHLDALMTQAEELTVTKIGIAHANAEIEEMATLWEEWKAFARKGENLNSSSLGINPYQERLEKTLDSLRTLTREHSNRLDSIAGDLREKIRTLRLLPLSTIFQLFPRMVRDLARQQSKEVELIIEGGETTADKRILEEIKDSLMHMIRNAIDHGIEPPAEREKLGKPPVATIWLKGYKTATNIVIEVADDGRGLDVDKIKQTAIKRGIYDAEELATMTPSQIHALILAPGFSTRTFITEISGRGIGLDVVRTNIERLKGNIHIESTLGQGCTFRIQLSTTLTTVNAMLAEIQGVVHALPIEFVQTTLLISQEQIVITEGRETIALDGKTIPVANLADLLELSNSLAYASTTKVEPQKSDLQPCVLIEVGEQQSGFFVDRLLDTQEVVVKPQSQLLKRVRNVTGATILPTGEVCMILNPPDLLKSLQKQTSVPSIKLKKTVRRQPVILLVEDSIPVRTQEKRLLEKAGYEVVIAVDGLDGYKQLQTRDFDAVLSDVEMPHLDGLSLTATIRQHQKYNELPIILVTTLASDEDKRRGAEAGANAYIMKGKFNQDVLLEILEKLI